MKQKIAILLIFCVPGRDLSAARVLVVGKQNKLALEVQREIQKRIENRLQGFEICEKGELSAGEFEKEKRRSALLQLTRHAERAKREKVVELNWVKEFDERSKPLRKVAGVESQASLVLAARLFWSLEKDELAEARLRLAVLMHPDREIQTVSLWDGTGDEVDEKIQGGILSVQAKHTAGCEVKIKSKEEIERIWINGFEMGDRNSFHLTLGQSYLIETALGRQFEVHPIRCAKRGDYEIQIGNTKTHSFPWQYRLSKLSREKVYLLVPMGKMISLYQDSLENGLSLLGSVSALSDLDQHISPIGENEIPQALGKVITLHEPAPTQWYNDLAFWSVASVVVGGMAWALTSHQETLR